MNSFFQCDRYTALVQTDKGLVKGFRKGELLTFLGIPYARARRFHAPVETEAWTGVLDACSYGFVCPLLAVSRPAGEIKVPHRYWATDEDCLNLNIWTPGTDEEKRPVLVWLHGGGYEAGSAIEQVAYYGASLSRTGDVVVVTVNHRLNILGYFDLSPYGEEYANSANAGGDDIIAALKWVQRNIAAFGGDPDNVTVFGQSGGGGKVTTLLQTPAADGLYARGVVMSGVVGTLLREVEGDGRELAQALMREIGISDVKGLEIVDYYLLARAYKKVKPALQRAGKYVGCCPHPNAFYAGDPMAAGFRQETKDIPLMVGSVYGEFASFAPSPFDRDRMTEQEQMAVITDLVGKEKAGELVALFREAYPERHLIDLMRLDFIFRSPEIAYINQRSLLNDCTWSYLFNMDQPVEGGCTPWHCSDIPYFFRNIHLVDYPHGPQPEGLSARVQEQVSASLLAFARTGNPQNDAIPEWAPSKPGMEQILIVDGETRVRTNYDHPLIAQAEQTMGPAFRRMMQDPKNEIQH